MAPKRSRPPDMRLQEMLQATMPEGPNRIHAAKASSEATSRCPPPGCRSPQPGPDAHNACSEHAATAYREGIGEKGRIPEALDPPVPRREGRQPALHPQRCIGARLSGNGK